MSADPIELYALDPETQVIGGIMLSPDEYHKSAATGLQSSDFENQILGNAYSAFEALTEHGICIDPITVLECMKKRGQYSKEAMTLIASAEGRTLTSFNVEHHSEIVRDASIKRRISTGTTELTRRALANEPPGTLITDLAKLADEASERCQLSESFSMSTEVDDAIQRMRDAIGNGIQGIRSEIVALDQMTRGFQPRQLIVLAARPSVGKTSLALKLAVAASNQGKRVLMFSLEMGRKDLVTRIVCYVAKIDADKVFRGYGKAAEIEQASERCAVIKDAKIDIREDDSLDQIIAQSRLAWAQAGVDMIIIDHLQIVHMNTERNHNRNEEISQITRRLHKLAKQLEVPILLLSQLSRDSDKRGNNKSMAPGEPKLSDLRESGAIEQDADVVMFLHTAIPQAERGDLVATDIIVAKNRTGRTGRVQCIFNRPISEFSAAARSAQ